MKVVDDLIKENKVMVFSKSFCPYCDMAKKSLNNVNAQFKVLEIEGRADCGQIQDYLRDITGARSVPRVFIDGKCIGGGSETQNLEKSGQLATMV